MAPYACEAISPIRRLPVVYAIYYHRNDMAAKLLETCPEKQISDDQGTTLMHWAAMIGNFECIPLLLSHGAVIDRLTLAIAKHASCCAITERKQVMINEIHGILVLNSSPKSKAGKVHTE